MSVERIDSPSPRKTVNEFTILEQVTPPGSESESNTNSGSTGTKRSVNQEKTDTALPLTTSRLGNYQMKQPFTLDKDSSPSKKQKVDFTASSGGEIFTGNTIDELLAHLNQQKRANALAAPGILDATKKMTMSIASSSSPTDQPTETGLDRGSGGFQTNVSELGRLKMELEAAKDKIAAMDHELSQQRITSHSIDQVLRSPSDNHYQIKDTTDQLMNKLQHSPNQSSLPMLSGARKTSGVVGNSPRAFENFHGSWDEAAPGHPPYMSPYMNQSNSSWQQNMPSAWSGQDTRVGVTTPRLPSAPQPQRPTNLRVDTFEANQLGHPGMATHGCDQSYRTNFVPVSRPGSGMGGQYYNGMNSYYGSVASTPLGFSPPMTPMQVQQMNNMMTQGPMSYRPRPIGTPLSPTALEFNSGDESNMNTFQPPHWANQNVSENSSAYMAPVEPMNYRRLLDRNMSCNWKYIVDKIVCSNDQQASIFLQQKLKISTPEQKFELVEAIIAQAYPLMINRFGNFLVQRCFEHGTPEQVIAIANAIRGNTLNLSMDAFGCHVVQKAFDVVPEDYKAIMVHELLRRIPETVIHRYACHVWQKLFELRWSESPPQIMKYVNEALRGMWHEVALGETGSLVVQNIFENCLEEDKRPCINEVLASVDIIAHGQFGNWCVQHICEHGLPADKSRAIEHVLRYATEYSTDQFASKVVEKCLKIGGIDFMDRYLERVCEGRADRPRMPLIDIAGDQYGNYLIQYILIHANTQHRDIVSTHVRKHMVSLRGSKFGSRVAMLCSNPAFATRPGPPVGMQMNNRYAQPVGMNRGPPPMGAPFR